MRLGSSYTQLHIPRSVSGLSACFIFRIIVNVLKSFKVGKLDGGHFPQPAAYPSARKLSTVRPRYHCPRFQILHAIYSEFRSLTSC